MNPDPGSSALLLVDFWASWCGPCRKTLPALDRVSRRARSAGLKVVGISMDSEPEAVGRFLERTPVAFQIVRDPFGVLARDFKVDAIPTALLLDRDGQEVARFEGGGRIPAEEAAIAALESGRLLALAAGDGIRVGERNLRERPGTV